MEMFLKHRSVSRVEVRLGVRKDWRHKEIIGIVQKSGLWTVFYCAFGKGRVDKWGQASG